MLLKSGVGRFKDTLRGYFKGSQSFGGEPLPEVNKALVEDAPRIVRLTIWGIICFFLFLVLWANFAVLDEVTRGDGKAIPSSKLQKIQNLEGGIVSEIFAREGEVVEAGAPLLRGRALRRPPRAVPSVRALPPRVPAAAAGRLGQGSGPPRRQIRVPWRCSPPVSVAHA